MRAIDRRRGAPVARARLARRAGLLVVGLAAAFALAVGPVLAADAEVTVAGFAFGPGSVEVEVGDSVTWSNGDEAPHTATGDDFDTGTIASGASASVTFDTAGTFDYVCSIHPQMTGTVVVVAAGGEPPSITPAPTDTRPVDTGDAAVSAGTVAAILGTMGVGLLIGTLLAGRRGRTARD